MSDFASEQAIEAKIDRVVAFMKDPHSKFESARGVPDAQLREIVNVGYMLMRADDWGWTITA